MKRTLTLLVAIFALTITATAAEDGFKPLFNGKDLTGWEGNPELWSVQDGAITGITKAEEGNPKKSTLRGNTFLVKKDLEVSDFELRTSFRIVNGNSGIQYRSKLLDPKAWRVGGYQADFDAGGGYSGILYDEAGVAGGRGIMANRGELVRWNAENKKEVTGKTPKSSDEIKATITSEGWNEYVVIAKGNKLTHMINGNVTVEITDESPKAVSSGILALQIHTGPPMTVQFKDIRIKTLSGAKAKSDLDAMQGRWELVELVGSGKAAGADQLAQIKLTIKGKDYSVQKSDGEDRGSLELTEAPNPRQMDITTNDGTRIPAIYEMSGDTMRVCYALGGAARPREFKSEADSGHVFAVYKRAK